MRDKARITNRAPFAKKARRENPEYKRMRERFMREHPIGQVCVARGIHPAPSRELHHYAGRIGRLLCYEPYFIASCVPCHNWIHKESPREARDIGMLAPSPEWNVFPLAKAA